MKVDLVDNVFLAKEWDALQWTGDNAEACFRFLIPLPEWVLSYDGKRLSIRRDYDEHSSREWLLDVLDWIVISPFDSLHVFSPDEFVEKFAV